MKSKRQWMATNRVKTRSPFKDLFPIESETLNSIGEHMKDHGYDESQPIVIWDQTENKGKHAFLVIDGHPRLQSAIRIRLRLRAGRGLWWIYSIHGLLTSGT